VEEAAGAAVEAAGVREAADPVAGVEAAEAVGEGATLAVVLVAGAGAEGARAEVDEAGRRVGATMTSGGASTGDEVTVSKGPRRALLAKRDMEKEASKDGSYVTSAEDTLLVVLVTSFLEDHHSILEDFFSL
jgi:hypothetical protein